MSRRMLDFLVLVVAAIANAACETAGAAGAVYVQTAPPPMMVEVVTAAPGPEYVWIRGYWGWSGVEYVWVSGHWARPPAGYTVWIPARYERRGGGWLYRPGHWSGGRGKGRGRGNGGRD